MDHDIRSLKFTFFYLFERERERERERGVAKYNHVKPVQGQN